jgi:2-haloacid dehalogenase
MMTDIEFGAFDAMTFDCYGTLVDWETGILAALRPVLGSASADVGDDDLLEAFGRAESSIEAGPYHRYREVLALVAREIAAERGVAPSDEAIAAFGGSVVDWPPFPDSAAALARLHDRFRLGVITNCDDDLFAASARRLGIDFDWVITAQQAGSYKPSERNFQLAFGRIDVPRSRILHVAQSLFHDHVSAKRLEMTTVWVDRRHGRPGSGATVPAEVTPDLTVPDMATLAARAVP